MKEATGELSTTVIAVVAIAGMSLLFFTVLWPTIKVNIVNKAKCAAAYSCDCSEKKCECLYLNENEEESKVTCPNQLSEDNN